MESAAPAASVAHLARRAEKPGADHFRGGQLQFHVHLGSTFDQRVETVAQIGAAFLIAYGVETTWVIRETNERSGFYQSWLGLITGFAICGLSGIVVAAALASDSGRSGVREVGFAWSCGSILMLGVIVAVTPILTYEWRRQMMTEFDEE